MRRAVAVAGLTVNAWFDTRYALLTMTNSEIVILSSREAACRRTPTVN